MRISKTCVIGAMIQRQIKQFFALNLMIVNLCFVINRDTDMSKNQRVML